MYITLPDAIYVACFLLFFVTIPCLAAPHIVHSSREAIIFTVGVVCLEAVWIKLLQFFGAFLFADLDQAVIALVLDVLFFLGVSLTLRYLPEWVVRGPRVITVMREQIPFLASFAPSANDTSSK